MKYLQRTIKATEVTVAVISTEDNGEVTTTLHKATIVPLSNRKLNAWAKENYGDNAVVLSVADVEKLTYLDESIWLAYCVTEKPAKGRVTFTTGAGD